MAIKIVNKKKRECFIDILRVISCFAVCAIHYISIYKTTFGVGKDYLDTIKLFCQFAVPCFFMISGYLYSFQKYNINVIIKKVLYYYIITVLINILCICSDSILRDGKIDIISSIIESVLLHAVTHLWFMPVLLSVYLLIPLISCLDKKTYIFTYCLLLIFGFIKGKNNLGININIIMYDIYLLYFMSGGIIKILDNNIKKIATIIFAIAFFVCYVFIGNNFIQFYDSIGTFILSHIIFILFSLIKNNRKLLVFEKISKSTFFIYLMHPFAFHLLFSALHIKLNSFIFYVVLFILFFMFVLCYYIISLIIIKIYKRK